MLTRTIKATLCTLAAVWILATPASAVTLSFDNAYTVGAVGSTTPVSDFDIAGPAPVLFVDLPRASFLTIVSSNWLRDSIADLQFDVGQSGLALSDKLWLTPSIPTWDSKKAVGAWHIDTSFSLVDLICVEAGGICAPKDGGSGNALVHFNITSGVPEPGSMTMLGIGLVALLGWARKQRT